MSDFSDRPLVADSITGVRSFKVDTLGRLTGVSHVEIWRPGVNEAKCMGSRSGWISLGGYSPRSLTAARMISLSTPGYSGTYEYDVEPEGVKVDKHQVASLSCSCGFYAYTDREANPYHEDGNNLIGIVRGSGVATVGSRGFRCESAEVVALVDGSMARKTRTAWDRYCLWADGHLAISAFISVVGVVFGLALGIVGGFTDSPWFFALLLLAVVGAATVRATFRGQDMRFASGRSSSLSADRVALVRRNYPDVQWFPSVNAAVKAFPLSAAPAAPVPSPDDADFWTRSAR